MAENPKTDGGTAIAGILSTEQLEQIRRRAYELYEARGQEEGHDVEDWLAAEAQNRPRQALPEKP